MKKEKRNNNLITDHNTLLTICQETSEPVQEATTVALTSFKAAFPGKPSETRNM